VLGGAVIFDTSSLEFLNSQVFRVGEFTNQMLPISSLGDDTENNIRKAAIEQGFHLISHQQRHFDAAIPGGFFEIQWHDHSVEEHSDDVVVPTFFCVIPFEVNKVSKSKFTQSPRLTYFDGDGKKRQTRINESELIIFNPRKKHSLDYYGLDAKLIIFSVEKFK
jgi:hypothetical protein